MAKTKNASVKKRGTFAWALWDWAEQPYPTIMQTFIFPTYIGLEAFGTKTETDTAIGLATAIGGVALAAIAPVLGRRSDDSGRRKFWLMTNTYILAIITAVSFFIAPAKEFLLPAMVLYAVGSVIQESAFINYYAMLKGVTTEKNIGRVSGFAWALGYVGGIILLMVSLVGFVLPYASGGSNWLGLPNEDALPMRAVFLFSAVWIVIFSIPLLVRVPEIEKKVSDKITILQSYKQLWTQLETLRSQAPETLKFLISSAVYRDGLAGVFTFGALLGTHAFGFDQTGIIFFGIAANLVSGIGAVIGGLVDDKFGSRNVIIASLIGLLIAGSYVFIAGSSSANPPQSIYWIGGLALCLFVGPAQASSRTFVARFTPVGREGEVFGLYQFTGRAVSFLSGSFWTLSILIATALTGLKDATIYGVIGLMVVLAVGLGLLTRVNPNPKVLE
jgi:UMF1 family MFS transporter